MDAPETKKDEAATASGSETTEETTATGTTEETTTTPAEGADEAALGDAGKRALKAERDRAKAEKARADTLAAKVKEYEDAQLSEQEKKERDLADATTRATAAETKLAKLEAALAAGLPRDLADRLQGDTPEALAEDAAKLAALVKTEDDGATPPAPGSLDGGARKPAPKKSIDEQIVEATSKGQWDRVDQLNAQKLAQLAADQA
jgi:hypothetical protein